MSVSRYVLFVWGCVDPSLYGPFQSDEEQDEKAKSLYEDDEEHCIFALDIVDGEPRVQTYSSDFFGEDE